MKEEIRDREREEFEKWLIEVREGRGPKSLQGCGMTHGEFATSLVFLNLIDIKKN